MQEYKIETVTRVTKEYSIEAQAYGIPWAELVKLASLAIQQAGKRIVDDTIRVYPGDDCIILRVEEGETRE